MVEIYLSNFNWYLFLRVIIMKKYKKIINNDKYIKNNFSKIFYISISIFIFQLQFLKKYRLLR